MSITLKIAIIVAVAVGDAIAVALVARNLARQGKSHLVPVVAGSCAIGLMVLGGVLFFVVD